ncbi:MAG: hypothetical protein ABII82_15560 [Verrucomicrobiota bacterium]
MAETVNNVAMALLAMHILCLFATCTAFALPLAMAGSEARLQRVEVMKRYGGSALENWGPIMDIWLWLADAIPVFWLISLIKGAPEDVKAAKEKWREESSIRLFFWLSLVLLLCLPMHFL